MIGNGLILFAGIEESTNSEWVHDIATQSASFGHSIEDLT